MISWLGPVPARAQVPAQIVMGAGPCTFGSNVQVLGDPTMPTVISGNKTYSGTYHVVGELVFTSGYFNVLPGTVFYIDGSVRTNPRFVKGITIHLAKNATFHAEQATFRAACDAMWYGFAFDPDLVGETLELYDCVVAQAYAGVSLLPSTELSRYDLQRNVFFCNYYHVYDEGRHDGTVAFSNIHENRLQSDAAQMLRPFKPVASTPSTFWFTREGLHLTPTCPFDGNTDVAVGNNIMEGAIYGITSTVAYCADLSLDNNGLYDIRGIGYWLDNLPSVSILGTVGLNAPNVAMAQTSATTPAYGVLMRRNSSTSLIVDVQGDNGEDTVTYSKRSQTGILVEDLAAPLSNHTLANLTYGISLRGASALVSVNSNTISNCANGFRILPNPGVSPSFALECNTIAPPALTGMRGIWIQGGADLQNQGTLTAPAGNKFVPASGGTFDHVRNEGISSGFTYYRYNSADEAVLGISGPTGGVVFNTGITPTPGPFGTGCYGRGFSSTIGVNRGSGTLSSYVTALMDTVRRAAAPADRLRYYTGRIAQEHLSQGMSAALETYTLTLPAANAAAYNELAVTLLRHYTYEGRDLAGAARLRASLSGTTAATADSRAWAGYLTVVERLRASRPRLGESLAAADSLMLRQVSLTSTGAAEPAAILLRYYCPGLDIVPASERAISPAAGANRVRLSAAAGTLRDLYPNPAGRQVRVTYSLPQGAASAELHLSSLFTGKAVHTVAVKAGTMETVLEVAALKPGPYVCTLIVNGRPVSVQRLQVGNE